MENAIVTSIEKTTLVPSIIGSIGRNLGIIKFNGEEVLTVATAEVKDFRKYYLGQAALIKIPSYLGESAMAQLKPEWKNARLAVVSKKGMTSTFGVVVEYPDATFTLLTKYPEDASAQQIADYQRLTTEYISAESNSGFAKRLKSWEEIDSGATIKKPFTSRQTDTGLWGQTVPIVNFDCNDCLRCIVQCPDESIDKNPITHIVELIDPTKCKACGICAQVCHKDAITLVDKAEVKAVQPNVFSGKFGKRIEIIGPLIKAEFEKLEGFSSSELEASGYKKIFEDASGKILQLSYQPEKMGEGERPSLFTFFSKDGKNWTKIIRPLTNIIAFGFSDFDFELAANMRLEGFNVSHIPSKHPGLNNSMEGQSRGTKPASNLGLDRLIEKNGGEYDAVVTAFHESISKETYLNIAEKVGVFLAPFMKNFSRDTGLDKLIRDIEAKMPAGDDGYLDDDRPLAKVLSQERDISSGHRACAGCPIDSTFNLAMQCVRERYDTDFDKIGIVNSGATGCAEVVNSIFPDTAWRKFLHTVFGSLGANLEGMNAAYRFLRKTGKINRKFKFFGWAGDGGTYDIGLQALSGYLERGLATDSVYVCYDNGAYMNTGVQRSSATPPGAGTSTSPIGEIVRGKPQFRKNLAEFATAHRGVYVASVSIAYEVDFRKKLQKAAEHDGPALIIAYSNCTTGHGTAVDLTVEQSKLAVESGFWPLFEFINGEKKISYEPSFVRKYEKTKQKIQVDFRRGKKSKDELSFQLLAAKKVYQDDFSKGLVDWLKSEARFALHFNKQGEIKDAESKAVILQFFEELKTDWNNLLLADRNFRRKEKLIHILVEYLREKDQSERIKQRGVFKTAFGVDVIDLSTLDHYIDHYSYFGKTGIDLKSPMTRIVFDIQRQLDPEVYFEIYGEELREYNLDQLELTDNLRPLAESLYKDHFLEQVEKAALEQKAAVEQHRHFQQIKERIQKAHSVEYVHSMEELEKLRNRAVLGSQPIAGRIFARAGDGGVTSAKLFSGLLGQIGIFGKASPDYGPERRGAPVGTNFQLSGKELRTQAGYAKLDYSIVKNPEDPGWTLSQWRDAVKEGGTIVVNTTLSPSKCRETYNIPQSIAIYTFDATSIKLQHRIPETITLMGLTLRAMADKGIDFPQEYLDEKWGGLLNKEFAAKAKRVQIVEKNKLAFWTAFRDARANSASTIKDKTTFRETIETDGFELSPPPKLMTGSEAVAEAWRQINPGVFAMFPITPSTEVGQEFSKFWADGKVDTEYIHTESEHSSFMTIISAAACGVRAVTSTASQGMLLGKEGGLLAATLRLPLVVNVGNRETNAPLSIHAGHTDVMQFRDDGWIQLFVRNVQEAYDFALIAQKIAEKARLPVFLNQDGFIVTHTKDMLDTLSDEEGKAFVGDYEPEDSLLTKDMTLNPISLQNYYSEHVKHAHDAQEKAIPIITEVMQEFYELTGRQYGRIRKYEMDDTDIAIVCMGSTEGTAMDAVDNLRIRGIKAGVLSIKTFRPFPDEEIRMALKNVKTVIVMDRMGSLGTILTPLATEVQAAIQRVILNLEYGRGGRNTPRKFVEEIYRMGMVLGWSISKNREPAQIQHVLTTNHSLRPLLRELKELKGTEFATRFKRLLREGRFIEAFGPKEHIDVREKSRLRDIKLSVIERLVLELAMARINNGAPEVEDLLVVLELGDAAQRQKAQAALEGFDTSQTRLAIAYHLV